MSGENSEEIYDKSVAAEAIERQFHCKIFREPMVKIERWRRPPALKCYLSRSLSWKDSLLQIF